MRHKKSTKLLGMKESSLKVQMGAEMTRFFRQPGAKGYWQGSLQYDLELQQKRYVPAATIAADYVGVGDIDKAFAALERGYQEQDVDMAAFIHLPVFDSIRSDPRYVD